MEAEDMTTIFRSGVSFPCFDRPYGHMSADVVIVGSSFATFSAAYKLLDEGFSVVLIHPLNSSLDSKTFNSSSKIQLFPLFSTPKPNTGHRKSIFESNDYKYVTDWIKYVTETENIECNLQAVDGFVFPFDDSESSYKDFQEEFSLLQFAGHECTKVVEKNGDAMFFKRMKFSNAFQLDPAKYLGGLVAGIIKKNGKIISCANRIFVHGHSIEGDYFSITFGNLILSKDSAESDLVKDCAFDTMTNLNLNLNSTVDSNDGIEYPEDTFCVSVFEIPKNSVNKKSFFKDSRNFPYYIWVEEGSEKDYLLIKGEKNRRFGPDGNLSASYLKIEKFARKMFPVTSEAVHTFTTNVANFDNFYDLELYLQNPSSEEGKDHSFYPALNFTENILHATFSGLKFSENFNKNFNPKSALHNGLFSKSNIPHQIAQADFFKPPSQIISNGEVSNEDRTHNFFKKELLAESNNASISVGSDSQKVNSFSVNRQQFTPVQSAQNQHFNLSNRQSSTLHRPHHLNHSQNPNFGQTQFLSLGRSPDSTPLAQRRSESPKAARTSFPWDKTNSKKAKKVEAAISPSPPATLKTSFSPFSSAFTPLTSCKEDLSNFVEAKPQAETKSLMEVKTRTSQTNKTDGLCLEIPIIVEAAQSSSLHHQEQSIGGDQDSSSPPFSPPLTPSHPLTFSSPSLSPSPSPSVSLLSPPFPSPLSSLPQPPPLTLFPSYFASSSSSSFSSSFSMFPFISSYASFPNFSSSFSYSTFSLPKNTQKLPVSSVIAPLASSRSSHLNLSAGSSFVSSPSVNGDRVASLPHSISSPFSSSSLSSSSVLPPLVPSCASSPSSSISTSSSRSSTSSPSLVGASAQRHGGVYSNGDVEKSKTCSDLSAHASPQPMRQIPVGISSEMKNGVAFLNIKNIGCEIISCDKNRIEIKPGYDTCTFESERTMDKEKKKMKVVEIKDATLSKIKQNRRIPGNVEKRYSSKYVPILPKDSHEFKYKNSSIHFFDAAGTKSKRRENGDNEGHAKAMIFSRFIENEGKKSGFEKKKVGRKPKRFGEEEWNIERDEIEKNKMNCVKVCANCGTSRTPLWRNGPMGPKSLCNACGIRFNKTKNGKAKSILSESKTFLSQDEFARKKLSFSHAQDKPHFISAKQNADVNHHHSHPHAHKQHIYVSSPVKEMGGNSTRDVSLLHKKKRSKRFAVEYDSTTSEEKVQNDSWAEKDESSNESYGVASEKGKRKISEYSDDSENANLKTGSCSDCLDKAAATVPKMDGYSCDLAKANPFSGNHDGYNSDESDDNDDGSFESFPRKDSEQEIIEGAQLLMGLSHGFQ